MRKLALTFIAGMVILGAASPLLAQTAPARTRSTVQPQKQQTPFTADYKITWVRTLANGTTITHESTEMRAVNTQGRSMTAVTETNEATGQQTTRVTVRDGAAQTLTIWDVPGTKATVNSTRPVANPCAPKKAAIPLKSTTENLGTDTIDGIEARGVKTTTTVPAGARGNSEPLVRTHETWQAIGIGPMVLDVRIVDDEPEAGKMTKELTNVSMSEPDASVFDPPSGYEVVTHDPAPPQPCPTTPAQ
jgi:hypothetical protein